MKIQRRVVTVVIVQDVEVEHYVQLSPREMEILAMSPFMEYKQIAKELGISRSTVNNHMCALQNKLSAKDKTEAILLALASGMAKITVERSDTVDVHQNIQ